MAYLLRCTCGGCRLPWAKVYNGILLADSTHRGKRHTNGVALQTLREIMRVSATDLSLETLSELYLTVQPRQILRGGVAVDALALICHQPDCGLPWGYIVDGVFVLDSQHSEVSHSNELHGNGIDAIVGSLQGKHRALVRV